MRRSPFEYLKARCALAPSTGCWLWTGSRTRHGYAEVNWNGKTRRVHQLMLELVGRPVPDGLVPDHTCRVRHCVNPAHLEHVTQRVNLRRSPDTIASKNAAKTHCNNGHPYDKANTIITNTERGWRDCRICRRARHDRQKASKP